VQTVGGLLSWLVPSAAGSLMVYLVTARVAGAQRVPSQRTAASASGSVKAPA